MGNNKKSFIKQNRLFLIIVASIVALIVSLVSIHYLSSNNDGNGEDNSGIVPEDNLDKNAVKIPEIVSFDSTDNKDVVSLTWSIKDSKKMVKNVQLYMNDKYVADVTGYSSWSLNKTTYNLDSGEVAFALIVNYENQGAKKIQETTTLSLHPSMDSTVSIKRDNNDYIVTITYTNIDGSVTPPSIYIAGIATNLFSVELHSNTDSDGKHSTSYLVHMDPSVEAGTQVSGRFVFGSSDVKDFVLVVGSDGGSNVSN